MRFRSNNDCGEDALRDQESFLVEFNTMFWLGILLDTMCSTVTGFPLLISGEDGAMAVRSPGRQSPASTNQGPADVSTTSYHLQDESRSQEIVTSSMPLRNSPLSHGDVDTVNRRVSRGTEWTMKEEVPTTILLFMCLLLRGLKIIQTQLDQFASPQQIENAVQGALLTYQQWQSKYETSMTLCVENYGSLPHKVRTGHSIFAAHWYYALMLLSSKLHEFDSKGLGDRRRAYERKQNSTAAKLALASAIGIARLATRCNDVNYPVSSATLDEGRHIMLSEPWCEISK